jgi:hypothetical protein
MELLSRSEGLPYIATAATSTFSRKHKSSEVKTGIWRLMIRTRRAPAPRPGGHY